MTHAHDRQPVVVVAHRGDLAGALQRRLDRDPLRATAATLGPDGAVPAEVADPSAIVLAVPTGPLPAWDVVAALHRGPSRPPVVVITEDPHDPTMDLCLLAGARTVLDARDPDSALVAAIDRVRRGGSPGAAIADRRRRALQQLVRGGTRPAQGIRISRLEPVPNTRATTVGNHRLLDRLGPAQRALVEGALEGTTVREVAAARGVSASAMYAARRRLAERLDVHPEHVDGEVVRRWG